MSKDTLRRNTLLMAERHAALSRARMKTWSGNATNYGQAERNLNIALEAWLRVHDRMVTDEMEARLSS